LRAWKGMESGFCGDSELHLVHLGSPVSVDPVEHNDEVFLDDAVLPVWVDEFSGLKWCWRSVVAALLVPYHECGAFLLPLEDIWWDGYTHQHPSMSQLPEFRLPSGHGNRHCNQ